MKTWVPVILIGLLIINSGCLADKWFPKTEVSSAASTVTSIISGTLYIPEIGISGKNSPARHKPLQGAKIYLLSRDSSYTELIQFWNNYDQSVTTNELGEFSFSPILKGTSPIFLVDADNDLKWDLIRTDLLAGDPNSRDMKCYIRNRNTDPGIVLASQLDRMEYLNGDSVQMFITGYSPDPASIHVEIWDEKNGTGKYIWTSREFQISGPVGLTTEAEIPVSWPSSESDSKPEYVVYISFNRTLLSGNTFRIVGKNHGDTQSPQNGTITVNSGALYTKTLSVILGLTCEEAAQSIFSNKSDFEGLRWEPFQKNRTWSLAGGIEGTRTVYVMFKDSAGNQSPVFSDSIYYDNSPPQGGSLSINGGASKTNSFDVSLTIFAHDASEMKLSNNQDLSGAAWEAYATSKTWSLLPGDGFKTVYIMFRDTAGHESAVISANVYLDSTAVIQSLTDDTYANVKTWRDAIHFRMDAGESNGQASVDIGTVHKGIKLFDDGTNGDSLPNNGVYELTYMVQIEDETPGLVALTGHFTDEIGNVAAPKINADAISLSMNRKNGSITTSTTWTRLGSPYVVDAPVTVESGVYLSIEAGARIKFVSNAYIHVNGSFDAMGTKNSNVYLEGTDKSGCAIRTSVPAFIRIRYCDISGFHDGIYLESAPDYSSGLATIVDSRIHDNENNAIYSSFKEVRVSYSNLYYSYCGLELVYAETLELANNGIIGNQVDGIRSSIPSSSSVTVKNNNIYGNGSYEFRLRTTTENFSAETNWWGTSESLQITGKIFDKSDDPNVGTVDFLPFSPQMIYPYGPR